MAQSLEKYDINDAEHSLKCLMVNGSVKYEYYMRCIPIGMSRTGTTVKVVVFGIRDLKNCNYVRNIKYVHPSKVYSDYNCNCRTETRILLDDKCRPICTSCGRVVKKLTYDKTTDEDKAALSIEE